MMDKEKPGGKHGAKLDNREECLQQCDNTRERINEANKKLRDAADTGDNQGVEAAMEEGAEITSKDSDYGNTGLHCTVGSEARADVQARNPPSILAEYYVLF